MIGGMDMYTTFQKINSGIPELDTAIDSIRMGDNVVWQVDSIDVFRTLVQPFVAQALADHRNLI